MHNGRAGRWAWAVWTCSYPPLRPITCQRLFYSSKSSGPLRPALPLWLRIGRQIRRLLTGRGRPGNSCAWAAFFFLSTQNSRQIPNQVMRRWDRLGGRTWPPSSISTSCILIEAVATATVAQLPRAQPQSRIAAPSLQRNLESLFQKHHANPADGDYTNSRVAGHRSPPAGGPMVADRTDS